MPVKPQVLQSFPTASYAQMTEDIYKNAANVHIIIIIFLLLHNSSIIVQ